MSPSTDIIASTCGKEGDNDNNNHHHRHFKMYKPAKVLTQFKFTHRKRRNRTLLGDVITHGALPCGVMAIGRLDEDSEGLLVLTTDGKVSEQVRRKSVEKEYYVQLDGQITQEAIDRLQSGVKISLPANNNNKHAADNDDDESACESSTSPASTTYTTLPCRARVLDTVVIKIENKKTVAAPAKEEAKQPEEKKKQPKRKRRKFSGTCNTCKLAGHKAKDCSENPVDFSNTNCCNDDDDSNNDNDLFLQLELALPAGIPPLAPSRDGYYNIRNTLSRHNRPTSWISITINEGKNRQIQRMTAAVGFPTMRLVRVRIGSVMLDGMVAGEVRELNDEIIDLII